MGPGNAAALSASMEDYLEAILLLERQNRVARVTDIATLLEVAKPSVTSALSHLKRLGLLRHRPYSPVRLTAKGRRRAEEVARRHEVLKSFLVDVLAVEPAKAEKAACRVEHAVGSEIVERLMQFTRFVEDCPRGGSKWIRGFEHSCKSGRQSEPCVRCMDIALEELRDRRKAKGKPMPHKTLLELRPGRKATVTKVGGQGAIRKRITDMGVNAGATIEVERVAPLGDPIEVRIRGYRLSLRKAEAEAILVEPEED